ncbi:23S rRNA (adenine(2030)-N(6))-methyltransferase RlmJ [Sinimarinibacterium thermocellulolyticum]|uniref:Ribosomal RNA large subunit methyltransferase J n=1 Tax=Sinimarinibacterium thermocellulolyticum TaxID=3170016 RepID=A0ABV2AD89_9GAMM
MHYQHRYHAGNFADVFKHVLLLALLRALSAKDKPWCYLDTHAGAAEYDLSDEAALRTGEFADGVARLWAADGAPPAVADWLAVVRARNPDGALRRYPGSPLLALTAARAKDRLLLCERVPAVAEQLRGKMLADPRVHVHRRDGYELASLLPPAEKRGLVLVDPPFERVDEFDACAAFVAEGLRRFAGGVFAVWYPFKQRYATERWLRRMRRETAREALNLQLCVSHAADGEMRACGLLVINPPYAAQAPIAEALAWLTPRLAQGEGAGHAAQRWSVGTS